MFQNLYKQQYIDISKYTENFNFIYFNYLQGFAPHPSSFIGIKEPKELQFYQV